MKKKLLITVLGFICTSIIDAAEKKTSPVRRRKSEISRSQPVSIIGKVSTESFKSIDHSPEYGAPGDGMSWDTWLRVSILYLADAGNDKKND